MKTPNAGTSKIASLHAVEGRLFFQRTGSALLMCFLALGGIHSSRAGTANKLGTGTELTNAASWSGGSGPGFPTAADVATWTNSSLGAGLTLATNSSWGSINVLASAPAIDITGAGTLTIGSGGITLDTAAGDMSFTNAITLGNNQTWNIGAGRTLTTSGTVGGTTRTLSKDGNGTLVKNGSSDANAGLIITAGTVKGKPCGQTGTITIAKNGTWDLVISRTVANLADGTGGGGVITTSGSAGQTLAVGGSADSSFSGVLQNGASGPLLLNKQGAGKLTLSGVCTFGGNITMTLGTLNIGDPGQLGSGSYGGSITFTAGTFTYSSSLPQTLSGNITGPGALTQNGPGTLTLSGTGNNYSGLTTVSNGTLAVSSAQTSQAGAISVIDGATLKVNVSTGQIPPSTLTVGNSTGGTLEFSNITSKTSAPINAGTLTINGTTSIKIDSLPATAAVNDTYPLVAYGSGGSGTLTISRMPAGYTGHLTNGSSPISLVIDTVAATTWSVGNGNWDTTTANWTSGGSSTTYADGQKVRFDDTASGSGTIGVTITPASVSPASITADNATKNYTIGGNPIIGATTSLAKSSAGTLTLSGTNSFGGGTTVSAGMLAISGSGTLGGSSSALTVSGGIVNLGGTSQSAGSVTLSGGTITNGILTGTSYGLQSGTVAGVLAGGIAATKTTAGTVILSGANTFSGGTAINGGTLQVNATETAGTSGPLGASGTITFGGGTLQYSPTNSYDYSGRFGSSPAMNIDLNGQSVIFATTLTGSSSLTLGDSAGGGILNLSSSGNGYTGVTTINSGTLRGKPGSINSAALTMNGGTFDLFGTPEQVVSLNGVAGAQIVNNGGAQCSLSVGKQNPANPGTFAGVIADGTAVTWFSTLQNNGTAFTLSGANTFSGTTTITAGGFLKLAHSLALQNSSLPSGSAAGIVFDSSVSSHAFIFGNLVGAGNLALQDNAGSPNNVALSVGNNNVSSTYSGVLSGGGSLTKIGTGRWILSGTNTYTGGTVVSNGNLWINGGIVGSATVKENATLGGSGSISGAVIVEAGGTLYPGNFGGGTLTLSNNLTLNAASTNSFVVATNGVVANYVAVAGLLTPNTSIIQITSGTALPLGIYSNLFKYGIISGSFNPTPVFDVAPAGAASLVNDGAGHINLYVSPAALTLGNSGPICAGNTLNLTANTASGTYAWTGPNGFTSSSQNPAIANATAAASGTYHCTVTVSGLTSADATTAVTVNALPTTSGITGTNSVQQMTSATYSVGNTSGSHYGWTVPAGASFTGGTGNSINVTFGTTSGNVSVIETNASGCTGTAQSQYVTVITCTTPDATLTPATNAVCAGSTGNIASAPTGADTYAWSISGGTITAGGTTHAITYTAGGAGTLTLTCAATNGGSCYDVKSATVTVNALPTAGSITGTNLVTHGTTNTYSVANTSGSTYGWSVPAGATFTGGLGNSISVTFGTASGNVTVTETNASGCTGTPQSLYVTVTNHVPVANIMNVLRTPGEAVLIALSDIATNWSDLDGDWVQMTAFAGVTSNAMNLTPLNLTTDGGGYVTTNVAYLGYTNTANVNDQFTYSIGDGYGGTNVGYVNIVVDPFVAGTQTITGQQTTNTISGSSFTVTYYGIPGYTYLLERSTNLTTWVDISTNTIGSGGVTNVIDNFSDLPGAPSSAYYRVGWKTSY